MSENDLFVVNNFSGRTPFEIQSSTVEVLERDSERWPTKVRAEVDLSLTEFGQRVVNDNVKDTKYEEQFIEGSKDRAGEVFSEEKFTSYKEDIESTSATHVLENELNKHSNVFARKKYFKNQELIVCDRGEGEFR